MDPLKAGRKKKSYKQAFILLVGKRNHGSRIVDPLKVNSMTAIVEGVLKKGTIELLDIPSGLQEGRVRVIVITKEQTKPPPCLLTFGKYQTGRMSTLEDFEAAQWRGEAEFDPNHG